MNMLMILKYFVVAAGFRIPTEFDGNDIFVADFVACIILSRRTTIYDDGVKSQRKYNKYKISIIISHTDTHTHKFCVPLLRRFMENWLAQ